MVKRCELCGGRYHLSGAGGPGALWWRHWCPRFGSEFAEEASVSDPKVRSAAGALRRSSTAAANRWRQSNG